MKHVYKHIAITAYICTIICFLNVGDCARKNEAKATTTIEREKHRKKTAYKNRFSNSMCVYEKHNPRNF